MGLIRKLLLSFIIFFPLIVYGQSNSLQIELKSDKSIQSEPRQNVSSVFKITNTSDKNLNILTSIDLPKGWKLLIKDTPTSLAPGQSTIKFFNIFVPEQASAGIHELKLFISDGNPNNLLALFPFKIEVLPSINLILTKKQAPGYVIDGDSFEAVFLAENKSNLDLMLELTAKGAADYEYTVQGFPDRLIPVSAGNFQEIKIHVKTNNNLLKTTKYHMNIELSPQGELSDNAVLKSRLPARSSFSVDIFPRMKFGAVEYHRFPTILSIRHSESILPNWQSNTVFNFKGKGTIDEEGEHNLDFTLNKVLYIPGAEFFDSGDRLSAHYWTDRYDILAGDNTYALSPLVAPGLYGRGIQAGINLNTFNAAAFFHQTPLESDADGYLGGIFGYTPYNSLYPDEYRYKINLDIYNKISEALLFGVDQEFKPTINSDFKLEIAGGSPLIDGNYSSPEWAGSLRGMYNLGWFNSNINLHLAAPNFPGASPDRLYINTRSNFRLLENFWKINTGLTWEQRNLLMDEDKESASAGFTINIGNKFLWLNPRHDLSFNWTLRNQKDQLAVPDFNLLNNKLNLGYKHSFYFIDLDAKAELDIDHNRLTDITYYQQNYSLSNGFRINKYYTYNLGANFFIRDSLNAIFQNQYNWFTNINYKGKKVLWDFGFKNNFYFLNTNYSYANLAFSSGFKYSFSNRSIFSAQFNYSLPIDTVIMEPAISFSLNYSIPLDIPLARKKNIGTLDGYVFDKQTNIPLKNIIARINGKTVVSNRDGHFMIGSIPPGEYLLDIQGRELSSSLVPDKKLPLSITIESGKDTEIEIGMITSCIIEGKVDLYSVLQKQQGLLKMIGSASKSSATNKYPEDDLVYEAAYPNLLVKIEHEDEVHRIFTNSSGLFKFPDLRPGTWKLSLEEASLAPNQYFKKETFILEVEPGAKKFVDIPVYPIKTVLSSIKQGGTLVLSGGSKPDGKPIAVAKTDMGVGFELPQLSPDNFDSFSKTMERLDFNLNTGMPKLLGLNWAISPEETKAALFVKETDSDNFKLISDMDTGEGLSSESDYFSRSADKGIITYMSQGINLYNMPGKNIYSYYNPVGDINNLYLIGVNILLESEGDNMNIMFKEILNLFFTKWRISLSGKARDEIFNQGFYEAKIKDIVVRYELRAHEGEIAISYFNDRMKRIIESGIFIR